MKSKIIFLLILLHSFGQSIAQNIITGIRSVKIISSNIEVKYQNENYSLFIFNDSAKFYFELDSLKPFIPNFILPNTAEDGNYIGFYDKQNLYPAIKALYKNHKLDSLLSFFNSNGLPLKIANYSNGIENGFTFFYDGFGNLTQLVEFKSGIRDGYSLAFFDPSHPSLVCNYSQGKLNGEYKEWGFDFSNNYILTKHYFYRNGKIISLDK